MLLLIIIAQYYCIYQLSMVPSRKKKLRCCVFVFLFFSLCFFFLSRYAQHPTQIHYITINKNPYHEFMFHDPRSATRAQTYNLTDRREREREEGMKKKRENELKKNVFLCLPSGLKKIIF